MQQQIFAAMMRIRQARAGGRTDNETRAVLIAEGFAAGAVAQAMANIERAKNDGTE